MRSPPKPTQVMDGSSRFSDRIKLAPCKSPLGSPALMNRCMVTTSLSGFGHIVRRAFQPDVFVQVPAENQVAVFASGWKARRTECSRSVFRDEEMLLFAVFGDRQYADVREFHFPSDVHDAQEFGI